MNKEVKAPNDYTMFCDMKKVFLAGSIEQGKAIEWQDMIVSKANKNNVLFLNPRRDSWDDTLEQNINNPVFNEQVNWELDALEEANLIIMYFDANTISPITLLEFGLHCKSGKLVVYCPDGYFRKGNIDVTSKKYNVKLVSTLNELVDVVNDL